MTAALALGQASADQAGATYQWSVSGARLTSDARSASITFVADAAGTVSLLVNVSVGGTGFTPTATVTIVSAETAGQITAAPTIAANATSATASVPPAQNNDRTFRWTLSGGAAIVSGQGTNSITYRPGTPGLKQLTCAVNFRNIVTVPVRSYVVALGTGDPVKVTINGGSGGGTYPAGSQIDLLANPPGPGEVFDRWMGDTAVLGTGPLAATLARTAITVPSAPVTLTATYKAAPAWEPVVIAEFNPQVLPASVTGTGTATSTTATTPPTTTKLSYQVPADARGLVFLVHATGSSSDEWFDRPSQYLLLRELVAAGYGIAALNSVNRAAATWAAPAVLANNPDALNHLAALDRLAALGRISPQTPVFFLGNGAGANAAVRYADLLATASPARPVRGAVLFLSAGVETLAVTSRVPQFFALAANDDTLGVTGLQDARDNSQLLLGRGIATNVVNNTISPLFAGRFRILGLKSAAFSAADATAIWTAIKDAGFIDANSYPKSVPGTTALTAALPAAYRSRVAEIGAEIAIAAAEREFFSDANARVINFLNGRIANAPVTPPGRLVNLSTRGRIAYLGDSLAVGFTLAGTQRATLLLRAVGPGLSRFRVDDAIAAVRLEVFRGGTSVGSNFGWDGGGGNARTQISNAATSVGAFQVQNNSLDSALLVPLDPGSYTAVITGVGGAVGEAMAEIYDVSRNDTRLTNLSTLSRINQEGDALIPGIVIAGNNPRALVVRAVAQGLIDFGMPADSVLGDPRLTVFSGNQNIAANNNWAQTGAASLTAAFPAIGAFPLRSAADSALLDALAPGSYTIQASAAPGGTGATSATGAVLVEVYELP